MTLAVAGSRAVAPAGEDMREREGARGHEGAERGQNGLPLEPRIDMPLGHPRTDGDQPTRPRNDAAGATEARPPWRLS